MPSTANLYFQNQYCDERLFTAENMLVATRCLYCFAICFKLNKQMEAEKSEMIVSRKFYTDK